ncbi:sialic acid-binding Ig-like lectin 13 [Leuresthes tenuis]|uniref:sialic acid-binding Ig-like lectin 13 n=1 Tax=Leuresthes tenuis TaxID=355514 RepID=UPI003B50EA4F
MKEECRSFMAALSVNVVTVNMLLSVFFLPGVLADCYQKPAGLSITAPKKMEALSGSCLQIPCSFTTDKTTFNIRGTIYGVWIKIKKTFALNPNNVVFNSSKSTNIYQMKITGNLSQKNCTTLFSDLSTAHTDKYFFRVENGPFRATACDDPIQITVKDSAWKPRINIPGELKEKESVTITCSAFTPCPHSPPELTWNLQQNSHRQMEENTDGTFTAKIQETITLSDTHDGYTISCSVRYPVNEGKHVKTAETEVTLSVSYAPKDTSASISPSGLVSAGSWMNLSCSSRANPPISSFTWFKNSKHGAMKVAEGDFYRVKMTSVTDTESYSCVAANILGNQTSWIHLESYETGSSPLQTAITTVILVIVFICLVVCVWYFKFKYLKKQQPQSHTGEERCSQIPTNQIEEEPQYEDMNFFKKSSEPSSVSVQDGRQQQETVNAQLKESEPKNSSTVTADSPEDLYIQSQTGEELCSQKPTNQTVCSSNTLQIPANQTEEELEYEDMTLFKRRPEPSSVSVQDSRQQQETVNTQVKVSEPENSSTQTADSPEDLYAQVKKK